MGRGRLEAFSDGVLAIVLTIMVLELKVPHGADLAALTPLLPVFLSYVLSFLYVAIYWNNHHHMFHATKHIDGRVMWSNMHLLFWLSLVPFVTGFMGENHAAPLPSALYGVVLAMAGAAYTILQTAIVRVDGPDSPLAKAVGRDVKGKISVVAYLVAIVCAFVKPLISHLIYLAVALLWFVPDTRIEKRLGVE
jgi:uncharacterized membrane protein